MTQAVILYGPPASGKDTIGGALRSRSSVYHHFRRLRTGEPDEAGLYRPTTEDELLGLRKRGDVLYENRRYSRTYAIDTSALRLALTQGIPVLHLGQPEGVEALRRSGETRLTVVALWCPREIALQRLTDRQSIDLAERMTVWEATSRLPEADLEIDTAKTSLEDAVHLIDDHVRA